MKSKDHIRWQNVSELIEMLDIRRVGNKDRRFAKFRCIHCDTEFDAPYYKNQYPKSCNCQIPEKHGDYGSRLYWVYDGMKQRCNNPNNPAYKNYGGRGITVCTEWSESYIVFREWAVNNGYGPKLEIDRINNDQGYNPTNCRFVTHTENNQNKRNNTLNTKLVQEIRRRHLLENLSIAELSRQYVIHYGAIHHAIHNKTWTNI